VFVQTGLFIRFSRKLISLRKNKNLHTRDVTTATLRAPRCALRTTHGRDWIARWVLAVVLGPDMSGYTGTGRKLTERKLTNETGKSVERAPWLSHSAVSSPPLPWVGDNLLLDVRR